jgi:hypothetical protein
MPPVPRCSCSFCTKRRWELLLATRIERELHDAIMAELESKRLTVALEREGGAARRRWDTSGRAWPRDWRDRRWA